MVEAGTGFQIQTAVFRVGNQQAAAFQHAHDAAAEGIEQVIESFTGRRAGAVKGRQATRCSWQQLSHLTLRKPCSSSPHFR